MKYFLFIVAFVLFAQEAFAADGITITINGIGETWTLSPADQERFDQWIIENYKCPSQPPTSMPRPYEALPIPMPPRTDCVTILSLDAARAAWVKAMLQGTLGNVIREAGNGRIGYAGPRRNVQLIIPTLKTKLNPN